MKKAEFRQGSGYSVTELKAVGLNIKEARNKGIRVDLRRKSTYEKNIEFLMGTYSLGRQEVKIAPKTKVVKEAPKKKAPKKVSPTPEKETPKKTTPAPKKEAPKKETVVVAPKETPKAAPKPIEKEVVPKPEPKATPAKTETATKPKPTPVEKPATPAKKTETKPAKTTSAEQPAVKPTSKKAPTTEELHKMYNDETGKNAIWRGRESGVYLKWLDKKKKDLGL